MPLAVGSWKLEPFPQNYCGFTVMNNDNKPVSHIKLSKYLDGKLHSHLQCPYRPSIKVLLTSAT